jgi:uncharacterized membrane protein
MEQVFRFWVSLENFPRFMGHLREVRASRLDASLWTMAWPGGVPVE